MRVVLLDRASEPGGGQRSPADPDAARTPRDDQQVSQSHPDEALAVLDQAVGRTERQRLKRLPARRQLVCFERPAGLLRTVAQLVDQDRGVQRLGARDQLQRLAVSQPRRQLTHRARRLLQRLRAHSQRRERGEFERVHQSAVVEDRQPVLGQCAERQQAADLIAACHRVAFRAGRRRVRGEVSGAGGGESRSARGRPGPG